MNSRAKALNFYIEPQIMAKAGKTSTRKYKESAPPLDFSRLPKIDSGHPTPSSSGMEKLLTTIVTRMMVQADYLPLMKTITCRSVLKLSQEFLE
jgi:hypothetical protein